MPGVPALAVVRVLERLELEPDRIQSCQAPVCDEKVAPDRHEVGHRMAHPGMAMEPETAGHRMRHAVTAPFELAPDQRPCVCFVTRAYWQPITPSTVAGATAATLPMKMAHVSGYEAGWVAIAPHPELVAVVTVSTTPGDER